MAEKAQQIKYQCVWDGKVYNTEEEAMKCCNAPIQAFITNYDRYPRKGFFGTVTWRKKPKQ